MPSSLLRMRGISKSFPGIRALDGVDLDLSGGEVLALLGENGAGKSTLLKILGGAVAPDAGSIEINGQPVSLTSPVAARRAGVSIIYQEFNLAPGLSARENIFLCEDRSWLGLLAKSREEQKAKQLFRQLGLTIDPNRLCCTLTVAEQQAVEIAKALTFDARIIVLDEPSAALSSREVESLFRILRELKARGVGIIYVTHRLSEVFEIADRVQVLRDGRPVGVKPVQELTRASMIEMMVGRSLDQEFPKQPAAIGEERLVVKNLSRGKAVQDVSFAVRRGEVVALTGLVGAGRTEVARLLFGADRPDAGEIRLDGRTLSLRHPRQAMAAGIGFLTEDRKAQGLILGHSVQENFGLPNMKRFAPLGVLQTGKERAAFEGFVEQLRIKVTHPGQRAANLSGGNQQKVVLAKWLQREAEVIIFDEPTRGIDVGAKYEIYLLMNRLAAEGKAILMISSELPEVLGMADRIIVMREGRITGEIRDVRAASQEQIMELAAA